MTRLRRSVVICSSVLAPISVLADVADDSKRLAALTFCMKRTSEVAQLDCFKSYAEPEIMKLEQAKLKYEKEQLDQANAGLPFLSRLSVRDSSAIGPAGDPQIGSKPALFQIGKASGESFSTARVSAYGVLQPIKSSFLYNWEPFFGASWDRDTGAKAPKDLRQVVVGMTGTMIKLGGAGSSIVGTLRAGYREDPKAETRSRFINLHSEIAWLPFLNGPSGERINYFGILPIAGILMRDSKSKDPDPTVDGMRTGMYAGVVGEAQLHAILPRLTATASAQWFRDVRVRNAVTKQKQRYLSAGITYYLVDPKAKGWVPSLSLTRELGSDPVSGAGPAAKTVLSLGVKFD